MSYENAPATKLLATHCAVCARPLVDAKSVETGIGPECRRKYGFYDAIPETMREEANRIVYRIAAEPNDSSVPSFINELDSMGLKRLAARLAENVSTVQISEENGSYVVKTPYEPAVVAAMRTVPGRRWDGTAKANAFPMTQKSALWALLKRFYNGKVALGPKGLFWIGAQSFAPSAAYAALPEAKKQEIEREEAEKERRKAAYEDSDPSYDMEQVRQEAEIYGVSTKQVLYWKRNLAAGKCPDGCCGGDEPPPPYGET